jgi:hypothetical protein
VAQTGMQKPQSTKNFLAPRARKKGSTGRLAEFQIRRSVHTTKIYHNQNTIFPYLLAPKIPGGQNRIISRYFALMITSRAAIDLADVLIRAKKYLHAIRSRIGR